MGNLIGRPQDLLVGKAQVLQCRATVDGAIVTIADSPAPTVAITDPDGGVVVIAESPTKSGSVLSLSRTWAAGTTPANLSSPYKAVWTFAVGTTLYTRVQYFFILDNLFVSQVVETDITNLDTQIKTMVGSAALSTWIQEAWGDMWNMVWDRTHMHPSRYPADRFSNAHIEQTKYRLYEWSITRTPNDTWERLARQHQRNATHQVQNVINNPNIIVDSADAGVSHDRHREHGFW